MGALNVCGGQHDTKARIYIYVYRSIWGHFFYIKFSFRTQVHSLGTSPNCHPVPKINNDEFGDVTFEMLWRNFKLLLTVGKVVSNFVPEIKSYIDGCLSTETI